MILAGVATGVSRLEGWRRRGAALGLGGLAALALPPFHVVPLLAVALTGLVWLLDGAVRQPRRHAVVGAFAVGWWFGLGHFIVGLYWIAHALLVDAAAFGWMIPFAVGGLSAIMGLFVGAGTALAGLMWRPGRATRGIALAVGWMVGEWLRTWVATGFPWNMLATVWIPIDALLQGASVVGALGLSGLTVLSLAAPAVLADPVSRRRRAAVLTGAALALLIPAGWGLWRLETVAPAHPPGVRLRLVQPNLTQAEKLNPALRDIVLMDHVALSREAGFEAADVVIWPETATAFPLNAEIGRRFVAADAAPTGGVLITGAPRITAPDATPFQAWNSLYFLRPDGRIAASYDKFHLVPFGEYVPFGNILPVEKVTPGRLDFSFGHGPRTVRVDDLPPVSPLICYEVVFPGAVVDPEDRPAWMVNVTNDGWYGLSTGPYQHFATARLRAVEEGVPLVRVANTGISGVIDAFGRVTARLELGTRGTLDADLPGALPPTPFSRLKSLGPLALGLLGAVIVLALRRRDPEGDGSNDNQIG